MAYLQKGYLCVFNGHGLVRKGGSTHYPLHRLIYEQEHGVVLPQDWVVHHVNGDPLDNRIENLEALSRAEHPSRHRTHQREGERLCGRCSEWKPLSAFARGQKRCKPCAKETRDEWAKENPERVAEYQRRARARYAEKKGRRDLSPA